MKSWRNTKKLNKLNSQMVRGEGEPASNPNPNLTVIVFALMILHWGGLQCEYRVFTNYSLWRERWAKAESNLSPCAYQSNTLPSWSDWLTLLFFLCGTSAKKVVLVKSVQPCSTCTVLDFFHWSAAYFIRYTCDICIVIWPFATWLHSVYIHYLKCQHQCWNNTREKSCKTCCLR